MTDWDRIENRLMQLGMLRDFTPASDELVRRLSLLKVPTAYVCFIKRIGCRPIKQKEQPFYWLDLFEDLLSFVDIWGRASTVHGDWHFFATSLDGECYALRPNSPDVVWWADSSSEPYGYFEGSIYEFFDTTVARIEWALSGQEGKQPSFRRKFSNCARL